MRPRLSAVVLAGLAVLATAACSSTDAPTAAPIATPAAPPPAVPGGAPTPAGPADPPAPPSPSAPVPPTGGEVGLSRDAPAPIDTPVRVGEWEIQVGATNPDANQAVANENMFNTPAEDGFTYILLPVTATYLGAGSATPWLEISADFVGNDATTYNGYCGVVPDAFLDAGEVYEGGTVTGNICVPARAEAIEGGVWVVEESLNFDEETARFFAST